MSNSPQRKSVVPHWPLVATAALYGLLFAGLLGSEIVRAVVAVGCVLLMLVEWKLYRQTMSGVRKLFLFLIVAQCGIASVWLALTVAGFYTYDLESAFVWAWHVLFIRVQNVLVWSALALVAVTCAWILFVTQSKRPEECRKLVRWKAAFVGAVVCGFIGPVMPLLVNAAFVVPEATSFRDGLSRLAPILPYSVAAILFVGPAAFLLGAAYGVVLRAVAQNFRSNWWAVLLAALLGLVFGSVVPLVSVVIGLRITYDPIGEMRTAAPTGAACGLLVFWLLQKRRLLRLCNEQ